MKSDSHIELLSDFLAGFNIEYEILGPEKVKSIRKTWLEKFGSPVKNEIKSWGSGHLDWHIFSSDKVPRLEGVEAIYSFNQLKVKQYYIILEEGVGVECLSPVIPNYVELKSFPEEQEGGYDVYISHKNFRWTFVITHDEFCGPYFVREMV